MDLAQEYGEKLYTGVLLPQPGAGADLRGARAASASGAQRPTVKSRADVLQRVQAEEAVGARVGQLAPSPSRSCTGPDRVVAHAPRGVGANRRRAPRPPSSSGTRCSHRNGIRHRTRELRVHEQRADLVRPVRGRIDLDARSSRRPLAMATQSNGIRARRLGTSNTCAAEQDAGRGQVDRPRARCSTSARAAGGGGDREESERTVISRAMRLPCAAIIPGARACRPWRSGRPQETTRRGRPA